MTNCIGGVFVGDRRGSARVEPKGEHALTYVFDGIIAIGGDEQDVRTARSLLGPRTGLFQEPFQGFAVAFAADHEIEAFHTLAELHAGRTPNPETSPALAFTAACPHIALVHLRVECWGGRCSQSGFAVQDGIVVAREAEDEDRGVDSPLMRLCHALGARMPSAWHRALERHFFPPPTPLEGEGRR